MARWLVVALVSLLAACGGGEGAGDGASLDGAGVEELAAGEVVATADCVAETATTDGQRSEDVQQEEISESFPPLPDAPGVIFEWQSEAPVTPFPWNFHRRVDKMSRTGYRLDVSDGERILALLVGTFGMFPDLQADLEALEGFGAIGHVWLPLSVVPELDQLPAQTGPDGGLQVLRLDGNEGEPVQVLFDVEVKDCSESGDVDLKMVRLVPRIPLAQESRYLVLVRRDLLAGGPELTPYPMAAALLGTGPLFGPSGFVERLAEAREETQLALSEVADSPGVPAVESLAAAFVFSTGPMERDLFEAAAVVAGASFPFTLDPDGDGEPNVFGPGEHSAVPAGNEDVAFFVEGEFTAPLFMDEEGHIAADDNGAMAAVGSHTRPFWLMVPAAAAAGPVPVAYVQHGLNSWKETMWGLGRDYASRGLVAAGFDFLHHKKGTDGGFDFVVIDRIGHTRDNFRQSTLDYYSFIRFVQETLVHDPVWAAATNGAELDVSRIVITGHSLGAIESALAATLYPGEAIVPLLNAGADLQYLMVGFLKESGLYDIAPCDLVAGTEAAAEQVMSGMDPGIVAPYLWSHPRPGYAAKPYLLEVGMHDGTVYPETGYALARALGSPQVIPCVECWPHLPEVTADETHVGTVQLDADHEMFFGGDGPDVKAIARAVYFHFVDTGLSFEAPEILWPVD